MAADALAASLIRIAVEDLAAARLLAPSNNRNAIYLVEQAAEKIIRAVLTDAGIHAGIGHHLDQMVDQLPDASPLKVSLRSLEHLGAYATSYRYPTAVGRIRPPPAPPQLAELTATVEAVLAAVARHLGVELP